MKILQISDYNNIFDYLNIGSDQIISIIKEYRLEFFDIKDRDAEWKIKFPPFIYTFYKQLYLHNRIVDQHSFYNEYLNENSECLNSLEMSPKNKEGLKARIYRTYPSILRDFHFNTLAREELKKASVLYNTKLDIEEGIDLLIKYDEKYYAINLYTNTKRAKIGRSKKANRHESFSNVSYIELPVDLKNCYKCGDFFLYGKHELNLLIKEISYIHD